MMTRPRPTRLLLCALVALALGLAAPISSVAAEQTATTPTAPAGETSVPAPAPEATATTPVSPPAEAAPAPAEEAPQVQSQSSQGSTPSGRPTVVSHAPAGAKAPGGEPGGPTEGSSPAQVRAKHSAPSPSALTPSLSPGLESLVGGVPSFFIESFGIPPFLLPIFQAAGTAYGVPWQVLAAINEVETDYGRDVSISSAGAEGWMQFLPGEWAQYGVDANGDGFKDPYNPADAIFAAARYLRAAGGDTNIKAAVFSYNHSAAYMESVMLRAQLLGGTPPELLGAITGLTEARFPVHAAAHFSDGFPTVAASGSTPAKTLVGTTIDSLTGAPVIAVQDGEIVQIGDSPSLGKFISLRDAYGNTYTYAQLGDVAPLYPVLVPHLHSAVSARIAKAGAAGERPPGGPATAGAQPRSPVSEAAVVSGLALGAAANLESPTVLAHHAAVKPARKHPGVRVFSEGSEDVYLHALRPGVQVIAGTILGHVGAVTLGTSGEGQPHILFQIRPSGAGAPLIDPKPILDGWVALGNTSIFRAKGENPFLATSPTVGQVLLESKLQLEPQVLHDAGIHLGACGRQAVQSGRVDKRVLATLEYLSVSGLKPTVSGLKCVGAAAAVAATSSPAGSTDEALDITAVNGTPIAAHQGPGSIADATVRKLLMLQGVNRPQQLISLMSYPGVAGAIARPSARDHIHIAFQPLAGALAHGAAISDTVLGPSEWIELIARLGEIPDPTVASGPSAAAIPDGSSTSVSGVEGVAGGNG